MTNPNHLIPEDIQEELIAIRDSLSSCFWRVGDIVNALTEAHKDSELGKESIYQSVGLFVGKKSRTVREYAAVARKFDEKWRQAYDMLSFDHFRFALRMGDSYDKVLEWAVTEGATTRPATVDALVAEFGDKKDLHANYMEDIKTKGDAFIASIQPFLNSPAGETVKIVKASILDLIDDISQLEMVVE
jgi:hypothetical protein